MSVINAQFVGKLDSKGIAAAMARKEKAVLYKTSAYARTTMSRGMRRRKGPGPIGGYPNAHVGGIRQLIAFAVDEKNGTAVIGPKAFKKQPPWLPSGIKTVPQLLNEGGQVRRKIYGEARTRTYEPRPFVQKTNSPAAERFAENMKNLPLK